MHRVRTMSCSKTKNTLPVKALRIAFSAHKVQKIEIPKHSMYGLFSYIHHKNGPNVSKYTSPIECLGLGHLEYPNAASPAGQRAP